jgi:hypothetical protein
MNTKKDMATRLRAALVLALCAVFLVGCGGSPAGGSTSGGSSAKGYSKPFATYKSYSFSGKVDAADYVVEKDLANVENLWQFTGAWEDWQATQLSQEALGALEKNGFFVDGDPGNGSREFFMVYDNNMSGYVPSFVTADSALHSYHLMFDHVLQETEEDYLSSILLDISQDMLDASLTQYGELKGTPFENAAKRNVAYFSVGLSLLDPDYVIDASVATEVAQELALIEAGSFMEESVIMNLGETFASATEYESIDYSQFIPRSHYTKSVTLERYFRAQKWYGQLTFRSAYEDEVRSALLICAALKQGENETNWYKLFEPINFFVGECDDITFYQYEQALSDIYGSKLGDLATVTDEEKFEKALEMIGKLEPPQVNSLPLDTQDPDLDTEKAITGFRFLGERFTIDAAIFQKLMNKEVKDRYLPKALDVPAAFGSEEAVSILKEEGVMEEFPDYEGKLLSAQEYFADTEEDVWTSNLYWSWLYALQPFVDNQEDENLPLFMQNEAWIRKELNTFEGSWTELKHDTLLYTKQPEGGMGAGMPSTPPPDDRGYVEPNPEFWGRLTSLTQMTYDGLTERDMISEETAEMLLLLRDRGQTFTEIAEKELTGGQITDAEYEIVREYGRDLYKIWEEAKRDELQGKDAYTYLYDHPGGIIADVATGDGQVLEEATGFFQPIYVVFERDGKPVIGRGAVYSQYEFTVPATERMTDDDWHALMKAGDLPDPADWQLSFMVEDATDYSY